MLLKEEINHANIELIKSAENEVVFVIPLFKNEDSFLEIIEKSLQKGVTVCLLTEQNSKDPEHVKNIRKIEDFGKKENSRLHIVYVPELPTKLVMVDEESVVLFSDCDCANDGMGIYMEKGLDEEFNLFDPISNYVDNLLMRYSKLSCKPVENRPVGFH